MFSPPPPASPDFFLISFCFPVDPFFCLSLSFLSWPVTYASRLHLFSDTPPAINARKDSSSFQVRDKSTRPLVSAIHQAARRLTMRRKKQCFEEFFWPFMRYWRVKSLCHYKSCKRPPTACPACREVRRLTRPCLVVFEGVSTPFSC